MGWKYFPMLRPKWLLLGGTLVFDRKSRLTAINNSELVCEGMLDLSGSRVWLNSAKIKCKNAVINDSNIKIETSHLEFGEKLHFKSGNLYMHNAGINGGNHFRLHFSNLELNGSQFSSGDYFFCGSSAGSRSSVIVNNGWMKCGINNRIQAGIMVNAGRLQTGDHVFLNAGTRLSVLKEVEIGNFVFVSYNCMIFDNTSHSLKAEERRKEMIDGFPNGTVSDNSAYGVKTTPVKIGNDVWIGAGAIVLRGSEIGDRSVIGAGCTVRGQIGMDVLLRNNSTVEIIPIRKN